jgi:putative transposase
VQTCIVHLIRASLRYVPRRDYDAVVKDLRVIYTSLDSDRALHALDAFEQKCGQKFPPVIKAWRDAWEHVIPFLAFPPEVRRVIYTTDESVKSRRLGCVSSRVRWHASRRLVGGMRARPVRQVRALTGGLL